MVHLPCTHLGVPVQRIVCPYFRPINGNNQESLAYPIVTPCPLPHRPHVPRSSRNLPKWRPCSQSDQPRITKHTSYIYLILCANIFLPPPPPLEGSEFFWPPPQTRQNFFGHPLWTIVTRWLFCWKGVIFPPPPRGRNLFAPPKSTPPPPLLRNDHSLILIGPLYSCMAKFRPTLLISQQAVKGSLHTQSWAWVPWGLVPLLYVYSVSYI